jgi:predicted DNA-binding ribbon-helix-helix protein
MSKLLSELGLESWTSQARVVRLGGQATSICLELIFWDILETLAAEEGKALDRFLANIHSDTLSAPYRHSDFASLLRCGCLAYFKSSKPA